MGSNIVAFVARGHITNNCYVLSTMNSKSSSTSNSQNSKSRCHTPVRKTAVVHPFGWSSQRSFSGTRQADDDKTNEAAFSSLPTIFVPGGKNQNLKRGPSEILRDKIHEKRNSICKTTTSSRRLSKNSDKQNSAKIKVL